ncbi:1,4-alpha-glucan branching protein GlgB [Aquihabitans sp. McL0605]|uniref:1,4-alpha-glucan branching protein GlgB n=1 Tax=Aquihabitans sp. McL0605 TaxID=3415671 RepID=UPI003CF0D66E
MATRAAATPVTPPPVPAELAGLDDGDHADVHHHLGAHPAPGGPDGGVRFSVWAPAASHIAVVGDWNFWDPATTPMERVPDSPMWTAFSADARLGHRYKFAITDQHGHTVQHADPLAFRTEPAPETASIVHTSTYRWGDGEWSGHRAHVLASPMSVYEVHLGSWRRDPGEPHRDLGFRALATELAEYVVEMGFTHVELLPVMGHPFAGSWGYQVTSYFAPAARWGEPDDLKHLIDTLHQAGIGVILDWVPAHFPKDEWALGRFDGTPLYEHPDPLRGDHPDWGTYIFDFGRQGVRNFLLSNARYWIDEYHADALRVDAVASMLYLDYSRAEGEWRPNQHGGRENLEAVSLIHAANVLVHDDGVGGFTIAEESTAWPGVSRPVDQGGLGFTLKWNLGWMHDTLDYFAKDPIHRQHHHHDLTFGVHYAFNENFVLPLSHDEVVHGKRSLLAKMPGDRWQQLANLRALYGWMWAHPGKQLLFMGGELAQEHEWDHDGSLDWAGLGDPGKAGVQRVVRDLNHAYRARPSLWSRDVEPDGFTWLDNDPAHNVSAFARMGSNGEVLTCVANLSPVVHYDHLVGMPVAGRWTEVLNTDAQLYGGSGVGNLGAVVADGPPAHGQPTSARITLPPLAVVWLEPS